MSHKENTINSSSVSYPGTSSGIKQNAKKNYKGSFSRYNSYLVSTSMLLDTAWPQLVGKSKVL